MPKKKRRRILTVTSGRRNYPKLKVTKAKASFPRSTKGRTKGEKGLQIKLSVRKK